MPTSTLRRLLCDAAVSRVVFGPDSQVLDVGRAQRTVTGQMRRAVIARDKHCVYVDCTQPPARCEVHHAERHWADGGETSVRNAALLCWHHHDLVDRTNVTMRWTGNPDGARHSGWTLVDRHGRELTPTGTPRGAAGRRT
ncbi:HNH endonuclease signature motif containing protein [Promicromonospora sukumoe]|uniref:HNH endonuclease signature motif containing protein n=1 Tax=Promicromonospora sukumoe TaxID=88382 RepID=UPI001E2FEF7F|nr:HNH endonuclease signature motif containing protein [Promicromonospora sukumoe]